MTFDHRKLVNQYYDVLQSGKFTDIEILVGEESDTKVFKAHSLILKIRSPYFCKELSNNKIKIENNIIKYKKSDISVKVFNVLLEYIYSNTISIARNNIKTNIEILIAAHKLGMKLLCNDIIGYIFNNTNLLKSNFVLIHHVVTNYNHFTKISQFYEKTCKEDPSIIFKANDFVTIEKNVLLDLVKRNNSLEAIKIWDKLVEWAIAQSNELSQDMKKWTPDETTKVGNVLQQFIQHINFKEITPLEFSQKIKPFKSIFDNDYYIEILEYYASNEKAQLKFETNLMIIDSRIISSDHAYFLCNLIKITKQADRKAFYDFKLLLRGSRDGFDIKTFHECCDDKGPTITIASVKGTDEILGGFNPVLWSKSHGYIQTAESFIFSLDRNDLAKFNFSKITVRNQQTAIYADGNRGPCFGNLEYSDFELLLRLYNPGDPNYSNTPKGRNYIDSYERIIRQCQGIFVIEDYEVFQVLDTNIG